MKISYNWLKTYVPQIPSPKELEDIFTFHITEVESIEAVGNDTVFDLKILPDRAGDLLCHAGVARELSGLLGISYVDGTKQYKIPESQKTNLSITIDSSNCPRYMGRIVRSCTVGPSPEWVVSYLNSVGQRSINNIVDATNIVMLDSGHPVHSFDLKKLASEKIIVRDSGSEIDFPVVGSENIVAKIKPGDIVISDEEKVIALAGIKGGTNSGINIDAPYTTDLLLEVANFNATTVRKTGQRLSLFSDARKRFENNVPIDLAPYAMHELSALVLEMCPDAVFEDIVDVYPTKSSAEAEKKQVSFTTEIISEKLGLSLTPSDIGTILQNYHYDYVEENGNFIVFIPFWRQDIRGIHDMVEEIGRIYGYEKITPVLPEFPQNQTHDETYLKIQAVKKFLSDDEYSEVMNYTFGKKGDIVVAHGVKGKDALRTNLSDGMKESFEKNRLNAPLLSILETKLFEVGTVFTKEGESMHVCTATKKEIKECSLDEFIKNNSIDFSLMNLNDLPISSAHSFISWSEYPFIFRDVSFWSDTEMTEKNFLESVTPVLSMLSIKEPMLIDSFQKDGRYSYAFRFVFQSYEKTLTDSDIEGEWLKILEVLQNKGLEVR